MFLNGLNGWRMGSFEDKEGAELMAGNNGIVAWVISHSVYIIPAIQILIAIHAIQTGRNWYWFWIIFAFPLVGPAIYFFVEILPDYKGQGFNGILESILNSLQPGRELRRLQGALEETDTVKNRKDLADYYLSHQEADKAVEMMRGCMTGVFKEDPDINLRLSIALVEVGQFAEAKKILEGLAKRNPTYYVSPRELLSAKCWEGLGQEAQALEAFEEYARKNTADMEGWWRYGRILEKSGQKEKAKTVYVEMLKKSKTIASHHRRSQLNWIKSAKTSLKEL